MIVGSKRIRHVVQHSVALKLEDYLSFIHHPIFTRDWKDLGLDDDDLAELELCVMVGPDSNPIEPETGGVRIINIQPDPRPGRPSFTVLVCYVFFEHRSIAALLAADQAGAEAEITEDDRLCLRKIIEEIDRELGE